MKYPPDKLASFQDRQLNTLLKNAQDLGFMDQAEACIAEIESRKKSKQALRSPKRNGAKSDRYKAEEVLIIAQRKALSISDGKDSFTNPWGVENGRLIEGRPKVSGAARHSEALGPKSTPGVTRMSYATHISLSFGKSKDNRALALLEACEEGPDSEIAFIVAMRCWSVDWPSHIKTISTKSGLFERLSPNVHAIGEYSMNESEAAISKYFEAVEWMASF